VDPPLLEVQDLSVDISTPQGVLHAVRNVSFTLERGKTLCLVGESGCGKSMTALALMGLLPRMARRNARKLMFEGQDLVAASEARLTEMRGARMAMVFQEPMTALNPALTIGDQLAEVHRRHRRSTWREARERAVELLGKVGIAGGKVRLEQYPHQLSGGLRQRIMIAMALMCAPSLVIADEPTTGLDVTIQAQILRVIADLQDEFAIALLLISHDLGVVSRVADSVAVMYAGEIVERARVVDLFRGPRHPYTRGLIASIPVPHRIRPGEPLGAIPGPVPTLIGKLQGCAFRTRCRYATKGCADTIAQRSDGDHTWRCVLTALPPEAA
jgi:peptide/nickel transport system ATP-binding protein